MKRLVLIVIAIFFAFAIYVIGKNYIFSPSDILFTFPQFKEEYGFKNPHNSLIADPLVQFEPWRIYAKERLLKFEIPFINDKSALGAPFLANPQTALFYPLTILYYFFPVGYSLLLIHLLKILLFFIFSYLYLRSIQISKSLAVVGAGILSMSSFFLMWLQWPHTNVYLLFPLILFFIERIREQVPSGKRYYVFLSLSFFFAVLGGHPETLFIVGLLSILYTFFRLSFKKICISLIFIVIGFLLSSFQLFPFLEYLFQSSMLFQRQVYGHHSYLPLEGLLFLVFPYLLGGPHLPFYKPLMQSNFQEMLGGYVGITMLLLGILAMIKIKKTSLSFLWIVIATLSFGISYGVFPFSLLTSLPLFNIAANQRFSAILGFSLTLLAILFIKQLSNNKPEYSIKYPLVVLLSFLGFSVLFFFLPVGFIPYGQFLDMLKFHILFISFALFLSFTSLHLYIQRRKKVFLFLFGFFVFFQIGLLILYNTFLPKDQYYPQTQLTKIMSSIPKGTYIEVGNNAIGENVNLAYGLSNVENYDALELYKFKELFNRTFPVKNQWGNVDEIEPLGLREFGINYVISDYDVRSKKYDIFPKRTDVLKKITLGKPLEFSYQFDRPIRAIRFLPATFNKSNICKINVRILQNDISLVTENLDCRSFTNNHFYTLQTSALLNKTGEFEVIITSNSSENNAVSFFGYGDIPYFSVLSEPYSDEFDLLARGDSWYVFEVKNSPFIQSKGKINSLTTRPESISFVHSSHVPQYVEVKRANFKSWEVKIDNKKQSIDGDDSVFLSVLIPKGEHFIQFIYTPYSFYVGLSVSLITAISLTIYVLYPFQKIREKINSFTLSQKITETPWYQHALVLFLSFCISVGLLLTLSSFLPVRFSTEPSETINWITVNNYPKIKDYFIYIFLFPSVFIFTVVFWLLWMTQKKHS